MKKYGKDNLKSSGKLENVWVNAYLQIIVHFDRSLQFQRAKLLQSVVHVQLYDFSYPARFAGKSSRWS